MYVFFFAKTSHFNGCFVFFFSNIQVRYARWKAHGMFEIHENKICKEFYVISTNDVADRLMKRNREKINRNIHSTPTSIWWEKLRKKCKFQIYRILQLEKIFTHTMRIANKKRRACYTAFTIAIMWYIFKYNILPNT